MTRTAIFAVLAASAIIGLADSEEPQWPLELQPAGSCAGTPPAAIPASGTWKVEYDNKCLGSGRHLALRTDSSTGDCGRVSAGVDVGGRKRLTVNYLRHIEPRPEEENGPEKKPMG
jgi:hypothetical protein